MQAEYNILFEKNLKKRRNLNKDQIKMITEIHATIYPKSFEENKCYVGKYLNGTDTESFKRLYPIPLKKSSGSVLSQIKSNKRFIELFKFYVFSGCFESADEILDNLHDLNKNTNELSNNKNILIKQYIKKMCDDVSLEIDTYCLYCEIIRDVLFDIYQDSSIITADICGDTVKDMPKYREAFELILLSHDFSVRYDPSEKMLKYGH